MTSVAWMCCSLLFVCLFVCLPCCCCLLLLFNLMADKFRGFEQASVAWVAVLRKRRTLSPLWTATLRFPIQNVMLRAETRFADEPAFTDLTAMHERLEAAAAAADLRDAEEEETAEDGGDDDDDDDDDNDGVAADGTGKWGVD